MTFSCAGSGRSAGRIAAHLAVSGPSLPAMPAMWKRLHFLNWPGLKRSFGSVLKGLRARQKAGAPSRALHVPRHGMDDLANALARYIGHVDLANPRNLSVHGDEWRDRQRATI